METNDPRDKLIVALDFASAQPARALVQQLEGTCTWLKVGLELYYAEGASFVEELRSQGYNVFLDLKLHDIPNTVQGAIRSVARAGAALLTVHASGGPVMMEAAAEAASAPGSPRLLAVTLLTSMDAAQLAATGVSGTPSEHVLRLAKLAWSSGIRGMVCSAEEVALLRHEFGDQAELVTPGIRPASAAKGDQSRVATPGEAVRRGASRLVVGRPITMAADPKAAAAAILQEITAAL